jgi:TRAP-type C4-dicarboxylate transport system permease small subunit
MNNTDNLDNKENKSGRPVQFTLSLRILIGMYLVYLSYSLIKEAGQFSGLSQVIAYLSIFIFAVSGAVITFLSLRKLIKGGYFRRGGGPSEE